MNLHNKHSGGVTPSPEQLSQSIQSYETYFKRKEKERRLLVYKQRQFACDLCAEIRDVEIIFDLYDKDTGRRTTVREWQTSSQKDFEKLMKARLYLCANCSCEKFLTR